MAEEDKNNIGTLKISIHGGKWMFFDTVFQKIISLMSFLVLARLLMPEDFGIITMVLIVPGFLDLITYPNFENALIQKKHDPYLYLDSIWTFNIFKSFSLFIIIFLFAPLITNFFHIEKALLAVRFSGFFILLPGLANVAQVFFSKEIDFKKVFIIDAVASLSFAIVSVTLAIFFRSFWALFFGYLAQYLFATVTTYFLHSFRPHFNFHFKNTMTNLANLVDYSKWLFGQNIIARVIPMIENSIVGKTTGASGIGLYSRAKSLASIPSSPLYNIINKVTFSAYSRIQDSFEKIKDGFLKSLDILFFFTIPLVVLFWEAGHQIILIILGPKWIGMDGLLKIFVIAITINALPAVSGPIFNAIGKPKIQFWANIINLFVFSLALIFLIPIYGIAGAAYGFLISSIVITVFSSYKIMAILKIKIIEVIKLTLAPIASSLVVLIIGNFILSKLNYINDVYFIIFIGLLGIFYAALIFLFGVLLKTGPYAIIKLVLSELWKK